MSDAGPLADLTRWNRTGLSRFDYVDGDAAVWLEELRIAMLGLYLRGGDAETRLPQYWRDIYLRAPEDWPDVSAAAARVVWKRLAPDLPPQRETRGRRVERLLRQYGARTEDLSWEINRAFARASHILLGYLETYANEGYLRTASQWDNLRRLAAMVNYQPTPPASATAMIGLILREDAGDVTIPAALAMKYTPPEGGAPLVFETLAAVSAHPALNAARARYWNRNQTNIGRLHGESRWLMAADKTLATGDLAVIAQGRRAEALIVASVDHETEAGVAALEFDPGPTEAYSHYSTRLHVQPGDVRLGKKTSKTGRVVVEAAGIGGVVRGDLVEVMVRGKPEVVEVLAAEGGELVLDMDLPDEGEAIRIRTMIAFALRDGASVDRIAPSTEKMWAPFHGSPQSAAGATIPTSERLVAGLRRFTFTETSSERAFASDDTAETVPVRLLRRSPSVGHKRRPRDETTVETTSRTVTFEGKPPKGLTDGDWFVARDIASGELTAMQVTGIRVASGEYHVEFSAAPAGAHDRTEFHGPMTLALPHEGFDRNPERALTGNKVTLDNVPLAARLLIRPGRTVLIRRQTSALDQTIAARVEEARPLSGDLLELTLSGYEPAATWAAGNVSFALNTVQISHGETKDSKLLGSGDGERAAQVFEFDIKNVSHIPSTTAEAGVVPDMTIAVDGERWDYRDYIDPAAAGMRAWSTTLTDRGTLDIHFRRRLVTGQNNVVVTRYRVGAGVAGSNIPALSFTRPMKKHRHVTGIFQPFATSGGADREPVAKLRVSTPKRLSANGRAVSLADFEHLAMRQASVLRARAALVPTSGAMRMVMLTVALAGGGTVASIAADLASAITARALPGVGVSFRDYIRLPLRMAVTVRADLSVYNRTDIRAVASARLSEVFSLERRDFGQTAYVSEILAALETVEGIENAIADDFGLQDVNTAGMSPEEAAAHAPRSIAMIDGKVAAIYASEHQIIHLGQDASSAVTITVESTP